MNACVTLVLLLLSCMQRWVNNMTLTSCREKNGLMVHQVFYDELSDWLHGEMLH